MPRLPKGISSVREKAIKLLRAEPYLTAWEIAAELEVSAASVSGVLYKDTIRDGGTIKRRKAPAPNHRGRNKVGWEYYVGGSNDDTDSGRPDQEATGVRP